MAENTTDAATGGAYEQALARRIAGGDVVRGSRCLYRPGELILSDRAATLLAEELAELDKRTPAGSRSSEGRESDASRQLLARLGLQRRFVAADIDLPSQAARLLAVALERSQQTRDEQGDPVPDDDPIIVSLNHVTTGVPHPQGGPAGPPETTGASRVLAPAALGADPDIAVLDTGVPIEKWLDAWHLELDESVRRDPANPFFPGDVDELYTSAPKLAAQAGHGTFISGLVHTVAPELVIAPFAVLDSDGIGDDVSLAIGLDHVFRHPVAVPVVNLSLGAYTFDDQPLPVTAGVIRSASRTSVVVAAAGNHGLPRPFWPAAHKEVVGVASIDDAHGVVEPTPWTNWGTWVDVCAVGEGLLSTYVEGEYETSAGAWETFAGPHPSARWSGTSFSAPLVAAEIARRVRADADTGILPTGSLTADAAWRELAAELDRLGSPRPVGLVYWPPVDPRTPRLP